VWSFVLEAVTLIGVLIVGRKHWQGWLILFCNTFLWGTYGIITHQYGFIMATVFYAPVYARNLWKWRRKKS
jgi:hypothetical protein